MVSSKLPKKFGKIKKKKSGPNGVEKLHKKFQIFLINERKVMPVLPKVSQGMFFGRHNTAAAVRAKRP